MKSSARPNIIEPDNFDTFIKYRKGGIRANLKSVKIKIKYYYRHYEAHGLNIHKIEPNKLSSNEKKTIIDVYEDYQSNAVVRFRDALFEHIPECAYCGLGEAEHLDHYLPKSEFSEYALYTLNLIPCCYKCNSVYKKTGYKKNGDRLCFHPYFDDINNFDIVRVCVRIDCGNIIVHYGIKASSGLDSDTIGVLKNHFKYLGLKERYLKYATRYLSSMKSVFSDEYGVNDRNVEHLKRTLSLKYNDALAEHGRNHWKTALLKNLKDNDDFCNGGFLNA